jgi:lipoate-protein ligase A
LNWRLIDMEAVDGFTMTSFYEVVAKAVTDQNFPNTLVFNYPSEPFVNVGFHQVIEKEVDLEFVNQQKLPIVRRTIGGGTILDGPWEQDYFFIVNRKSPECPADIMEFYRTFLTPIANALRRLNVHAEYKPINDIIVGGKKISGNGGISVGDSMVLAGDVLLDIPAELMTRVLRVPDEKFRDKLQKSLSEWMTSLKLESQESPTRDELKRYIVEEVEKQIGTKIVEERLSNFESKYLNELSMERKDRDWIFMKDMSHERLLQARQVKVKEGVRICESVYKAQKLIRIVMENVNDRVGEISISGDFFTEPHMRIIEELEESLVGAPLESVALHDRIETWISTVKPRIIGAKVDDFVQAILNAKETNPKE